MLRSIDEHVVSDLACSIRSNGLLSPILVRPASYFYRIVFGHHRVEACRQLGWKSIPAIVKEISDDDAFLANVVENLQRNNEINPLSEARGYISLIDHGWTMSKIAARIGKSDSYVSDRVGLIRHLHPIIANNYRDDMQGNLKPSHLELLARVKSKHRQLELSYLVERKHLSVHSLEKLISNGNPPLETVEERGGFLYVRLPSKITEQLNLRVGESVCIYPQSRNRITIERATLPIPEPVRKLATPLIQ
jgi:ParB family transcriptional regulator, chromosome partitioning protein